MNVAEVPNLVSRHFDMARRVCREIDGAIHSWMAVADVVQQSPRHRQIPLLRIVISERSISRCRIDIDYILQAIQRWFMIDRQQSVFLK